MLYTVGGNQAKLDTRTEFKILERLLKGGVEAGYAYSCTIIFNHNIINKYFLYRVIYWRFRHIRALYYNNLYKLHLGGALCCIPFDFTAGATS